MKIDKRATLKLEHQDFILYVSCDDIVSPLKKLTHTYSQRFVAMPSGNDIALFADGIQATFDDGLPSNQPFFFENRQYWFEIEFKSVVTKKSAVVHHKHRLIEGAFHLNRKGDALLATVNFGNDIGRCGFSIEYSIGGKLCSANISFNIFATKMVIEQDLTLINHAIDKVYPLWRYSLVSKTS